MTRLAPHTVMLRDQLVAALREAYPVALSANQVAELMPPIVCERYWTPCDWIAEPDGVEVLECHGERMHLIRRPRNGQDIHRHLCSLEREGVITRRPYNRSAHPCVFWTVQPNLVAASVVDGLETLWAAS